MNKFLLGLILFMVSCSVKSIDSNDIVGTWEGVFLEKKNVLHFDGEGHLINEFYVNGKLEKSKFTYEITSDTLILTHDNGIPEYHIISTLNDQKLKMKSLTTGNFDIAIIDCVEFTKQD